LDIWQIRSVQYSGGILENKKSERVHVYYSINAKTLYCTAEGRIFSSNPRRTHSGKKDKEKEE
jgi:hypothetical protein